MPKEKVEKALKHFKPLLHRLERVGTYRGITFYNDSLATIPQATNAALDILGNKVATLIVGGHDRGIELAPLAERILQSKVRTLILLPATGAKVEKELEAIRSKQKKNRALHCFRKSTLAEAVELCYERTPKGFICLLSPAASSFNMFRDYKERGDEFKKLVIRYGKGARA